MKSHSSSPNEWNITTQVGPMSFNVIINSAFFNYNTHQSSERHRHATSEFHFITEGSGIISTDDAQYEISPDSFYLIQAGVYHKLKGEISNPIHRHSCRFEFELSNNPEAEYSKEEIKRFVEILSNTPFFYSRNSNRLKPLICEIQYELKQKPLGYYMKVKSLFSLLFINIIREISMEKKYKSVTQSSETHLANRLSIIENFFDSLLISCS